MHHIRFWDLLDMTASSLLILPPKKYHLSSVFFQATLAKFLPSDVLNLGEAAPLG